jgi:hypothetical protein
VPGSEFSSQGYSLSLETEIPESDPAAIKARLHQTFETVKASVEEELSGAKAEQTQPQFGGQRPQPTAQERKASNAQIKYLTDLAAERKLPLQDLNADVRRRFGVSGIYDLTSKQASAVLDDLKGAGQRRRAA